MSRPNKLPQSVGPDRRWSARESWRTFGIMSVFVEATERLSEIRPAVSIFGSARIGPDHPHYLLAEQIARQLSDAGFSVISGGGPGVMEAANKGAFFGKSPSVGLNITLPHEQAATEHLGMLGRRAVDRTVSVPPSVDEVQVEIGFAHAAHDPEHPAAFRLTGGSHDDGDFLAAGPPRSSAQQNRPQLHDRHRVHRIRLVHDHRDVVRGGRRGGGEGEKGGSSKDGDYPFHVEP